MPIHRVPAIALPTPWARGMPPRAPHPGDTLRLTLNDVLLDDVFATTPDGLPLRLAGLAAMARHLSAGDVLLMRVVATSPRLELAMADPAPTRPAAWSSGAAPQAMQPDQLAQRQMSWRPPAPAALAASWRHLALDQMDNDTARLRWPRLPGPAAAMVRDAPGGAASIAAAADRWLFPAYSWAGLQVLMRIVDDQRPNTPRRRWRGPLTLRLEVDVPGLGPVVVQVQLSGIDVRLNVFAETDAALQALRTGLLALAAEVTDALARLDLKLLHCGLARGLPPPGHVPRLDLEAASAPAALLPSLLFRAAAEVAVALSSLLPKEGFSPVSR